MHGVWTKEEPKAIRLSTASHYAFFASEYFDWKTTTAGVHLASAAACGAWMSIYRERGTKTDNGIYSVISLQLMALCS